MRRPSVPPLSGRLARTAGEEGETRVRTGARQRQELLEAQRRSLWGHRRSRVGAAMRQAHPDERSRLPPRVEGGACGGGRGRRRGRGRTTPELPGSPSEVMERARSSSVRLLADMLALVRCSSGEGEREMKSRGGRGPSGTVSGWGRWWAGAPGLLCLSECGTVTAGPSRASRQRASGRSGNLVLALRLVLAPTSPWPLCSN